MCSLPPETEPLEVWTIEIASKTPGASMQEPIQELTRMAERLGCMVNVIGPEVYGHTIPADDSDPSVSPE